MTAKKDLRKKLHDQATRGIKLSQNEQALLDDWYQSQDREEMQCLNLSKIDDMETEALQKEINSALIKIRITTKHIQAITRENSLLRQEIVAMRQQLTQKMVIQPA